MNPQREVVITGVGVVSPIGIGKDVFWSSLFQGQSGVGMLSSIDSRYLPVRIASEVRDFDPKAWVQPRKSLKVMCREIQMAFAAAGMAVGDARLEKGILPPERLGAIFGSELIYSDVSELTESFLGCKVDGVIDARSWAESAMRNIQPLWMLKSLPNMPACHVAIAQEAHGPNNTITLGGASSLLAVSEAAAIITRGQADAMIVGGTGSRLTPSGLVWRGDFHLSHRNDAPTRASRPFDAHRDGMVNGEGAAAVMLEARCVAEARKAPILARVLSSASGFEPYHDDRPGPGEAIRHTIRLALERAHLQPGDVGHVNANGLGTVAEDRVEAQAIRDVLGDVPVTAPKSLFGNLGAGTGAVEMVASILALTHGQVPATLNYETPDPECPIQVIYGGPRAVERHVALLLNQSRTGQAVAVAIARE